MSTLARSPASLRVVGLFAGIGGIERGLHLAGHRSVLLCELDPLARAILAANFPGVPIATDVRTLETLPEADLVTAGFPCQDLSQAGKTAGIHGGQTGVVGELFRLLERDSHGPRWLLLENVPFMLQLQQGRAMGYLTDRLERAGFRWAYRVIDARAFGLPQRRQRVLLLASRTDDPRQVLFADDGGELSGFEPVDSACGFYWTEGNTGLGWAVDAVPTLKGGSTIGIPSPPAIWLRHTSGEIVQPEIRDAERLQGFPIDWTEPAASVPGAKSGARWKLVGNAVSVPVARWFGECVNKPRAYDDSGDELIAPGAPWPKSAWGDRGERFAARRSLWPVASDYQHLSEFLAYPTKLLSARASCGFFIRAKASSLRFSSGFLEAVQVHAAKMLRAKKKGPRRTQPGLGREDRA